MIWDFPDHREAYGSAGKMSLLAVGTQSAHRNEFLKDTKSCLCWVLVAAWAFSSYSERGYSPLQCRGFSPRCFSWCGAQRWARGLRSCNRQALDQAPPGSQASSRGEAKDSALLSSRDAVKEG